VVSVADDSAGLVDVLHVKTSGTESSNVLQGNGALSVTLVFTDFPAHTASSSTSLDQNPSAYPDRLGLIQGPNGSVDFDLQPGSGSGGGPSAACHVAQLSAAAKLCQSRLKCFATHAKNPTKDADEQKLDACEGKADQTFL